MSNTDDQINQNAVFLIDGYNALGTAFDLWCCSSGRTAAWHGACTPPHRVKARPGRSATPATNSCRRHAVRQGVAHALNAWRRAHGVELRPKAVNFLYKVCLHVKCTPYVWTGAVYMTIRDRPSLALLCPPTPSTTI